MSKPFEPYNRIIVESYFDNPGGGYSEKVHLRPVAGQMYSQDLRVEGPRAMVRNYPVGTRFRVKVKLTDREDGVDYLYSHHSWPFDVLE